MLNLTDLELLNKNIWYAQLPAPFQQFIQQHSNYQTFERDQAIFRSGDTFNGIYAVLDGRVRLGYIDIEGNESVAAIVEPIMWFGEISLVDQQPRSHDAIAVGKCVILHIPSLIMNDFLAQNPQYWFHIAQLTSQKLRFAFLELISIQTQHIQQRLAQRLMFILNGYGNHAYIEKNTIHLSQDQLALMLKCSRQTINQELHLLEQQGILKIAFKKIEILDINQLHAIAHSINESSH
ncbi:Crp/Fnr family transcriptional regulator [Acinetobacter bereziniae]|uniref:Crp/Fnr family transcriptional regulator n=1 Tax=Acinetobacter bereziniae TaxID=106648 RepID=UPI00157FFFD7|nr:Crp/Fnr family transcriptional regulator [Acinetobacter bereziniae]MCU4436441.1 Crp/Fnr family transcriptional regulator [Acinetobacter bereziniae]NUF63083.1 Crp/Fnr family transcriptional regulator [Acinetobacter bereziniae]NUG09043.1 Crp/Fnr family transcriptional regulator [Acinetobacter bereziniae]NUG64857.1 Crp/Fnr family transcriptional regulator [Acinetobacter bereziniae]NUG70792.1 Crp/Fnr family transcriptional regulator [Acinetobacter bereziniae]